MSALPAALLFLLSFLFSFPCRLPLCSSHAANQCNSHSVAFQATASGFTWLSLAGLFYCSRGWLLPGISTLLGLGCWMLMLNLCLHTAGGILQLLWLWGSKSVTRAGLCLSPNPEVSAQQGTSKVTWKKRRAEQAVRCAVHTFQSHETTEKTLK